MHRGDRTVEKDSFPASHRRRVLTTASSWPLAMANRPHPGGLAQVVAFIPPRENFLSCLPWRKCLSRLWRSFGAALVTFYKQSTNRKSTRKRKLRTTSFQKPQTLHLFHSPSYFNFGFRLIGIAMEACPRSLLPLDLVVSRLLSSMFSVVQWWLEKESWWRCFGSSCHWLRGWPTQSAEELSGGLTSTRAYGGALP